MEILECLDSLLKVEKRILFEDEEMSHTEHVFMKGVYLCARVCVQYVCVVSLFLSLSCVYVYVCVCVCVCLFVCLCMCVVSHFLSLLCCVCGVSLSISSVCMC